mmetsp:Transcript_44255/g.79410  ORF Transcript_44255/g.79410 Transcript_44255/m.79410 type:complete len:211 (+) Transcript_44255:648-1280(+)
MWEGQSGVNRMLKVGVFCCTKRKSGMSTTDTSSVLWLRDAGVRLESLSCPPVVGIRKPENTSTHASVGRSRTHRLNSILCLGTPMTACFHSAKVKVLKKMNAAPRAAQTMQRIASRVRALHNGHMDTPGRTIVYCLSTWTMVLAKIMYTMDMTHKPTPHPKYRYGVRSSAMPRSSSMAKLVVQRMMLPMAGHVPVSREKCCCWLWYVLAQ